MKTYSSRTLRTASLAIVTAIAGLGAGCAKATSDTPIVPVHTAEVTTIDTGSTNIYSANIQPYQQVDLSFQSNGYIVSIKQVRDADGHIRNVDQGDYVTQGTVLAVVQKDQYQQKLDQAKSSLAKSNAEHERAKLSFDRMTVSVQGWSRDAARL